MRVNMTTTVTIDIETIPSQHVQAGRVQEVATYYEEDVTATREVFRRLTFAGVTI